MRDVDGGRDHVVGGLPEVDMIVGVHEPVAEVAAHQLRCSVGDHLVGVRVGRRARARLEDVEHELIVE